MCLCNPNNKTPWCKNCPPHMKSVVEKEDSDRLVYIVKDSHITRTLWMQEYGGTLDSKILRHIIDQYLESVDKSILMKWAIHEWYEYVKEEVSKKLHG